MGQEIENSHFTADDFTAFQTRLREETNLLQQWFDEDRFCDKEAVGGFEIEAWLVDQSFRPAPINEEFLAALQSPLVMAELAQFNVELNSTPRSIIGSSLRAMEKELVATLAQCNPPGP